MIIGNYNRTKIIPHVQIEDIIQLSLFPFLLIKSRVKIDRFIYIVITVAGVFFGYFFTVYK